MDIQRYALIGAIAVLSWMLLTEWVIFKDKATEQQAVMTPAFAPSESVSLDDSSSDIPSIIDASDESSLGLSNATNQGVINVTTDTLVATIDLQGGDIVYAGLRDYLAKIDDPSNPFVLLEQNARRVYVAQSGLIGPDGVDSKARAQYRSEEANYALADDQATLSVKLYHTDNAGLSVVKEFVFNRGTHLIDVNYQLSNSDVKSKTVYLFGQLKRDSSADPSSENSGMGLAPFLGAATSNADDRFKKFNFKDMLEEPYKAQTQGSWIALIQHYFLSAWIPNPDKIHTYTTRVTKDGFNIAGFLSPATVVAPGATATTSAQLYVGPKDQYTLEKISPFLELSVDYGWLWWIAQPLFWLLTKIHGLVGNWGVAIILLTVLIKGAFFKLSAASYRSMANMRRVQPKMADIREQYADDKQKQSQAMMELYKKEKINPMGGCLPILVQMPVFIALYWTLMESVELRHAPFALWINDLSVMDPYFVLPILMGASMWFMQKLNPPPPDPMQAKLMQWLPIVFTFFFLWFPAGLVLYWVVNNLLSMTQQYIITKQIENSAPQR
ncbi:OxaI/YidC membrane insertion protein [Aequoribacter fuscus]|uniref:Membrane protein insertase YidC n=1 Tax=Aequoribacter fuscus TaxID=2518989 RepID=F3L0U5_9GAMM|nr:membrane protein insertase YidC [Aequoribacter fuscus]EGG30053.1 OxaI/YidC membrane insertion protein [Aequoribacter fuscus]QHJ89369.1 membrane protein insertase YidC [Aequoribacter fuscus]